MTPTELITRKLSHQLLVTDDVIDAVMEFQWKSLKKAFKNNTTLELTGLGVFKMRPHRAKKEIVRYEKIIKQFIKKIEIEENPLKKEHLKKQLSDVTEVMEELKFKLNKYETQLQTDIRGMEE